MVSLHVSAWSTGSPAIGRNRPSTRMRGGEYGVSMRSVAPASTTAEIHRSMGSMLMGSTVMVRPSLSVSDDPRIDLRYEGRLVKRRVRLGPFGTTDERLEEHVAREECVRRAADERGADCSRVRVEGDRPCDQRALDVETAGVLARGLELVARDVHDVVHEERVMTVGRCRMDHWASTLQYTPGLRRNPGIVPRDLDLRPIDVCGPVRVRVVVRRVGVPRERHLCRR